MAGLLARIFKPVGSEPYYASYERRFQRLTKDIRQLQEKKASRKRTKDGVNQRFLYWGLAGTVVAFLYAKWCASFPEGTFGVLEYVLRIAPAVVVPVVTILLRTFASRAASWGDTWDNRRLAKLQAKLQKQLDELKDSTRYDRTLALLRKYDPKFQEPVPRLMRNGKMVAAGGAGATAGPAPAAANSKWMGMLDSMATKFVGADPVLLQGLRDAKSEVDMLRAHLAAAQWHCYQLAGECRAYRVQLGLPIEEAVPGQTPLQAQGPVGLIMPPEEQQPAAAAAAAGGQLGSPESIRSGPRADALIAAAAVATAASPALGAQLGQQLEGQQTAGGGGSEQGSPSPTSSRPSTPTKKGKAGRTSSARRR